MVNGPLAARTPRRCYGCLISGSVFALVSLRFMQRAFVRDQMAPFVFEFNPSLFDVVIIMAFSSKYSKNSAILHGSASVCSASSAKLCQSSSLSILEDFFGAQD